VGRANKRHTDEFHRENNRNEAEDRSILRWECRVTDEIDRLMQIGAVAEAKQKSDVLVQAALAQLYGEAAVATPVRAVLPRVRPSPATSAATPEEGPFVLTFPQREAELVRECYLAAGTILEYGSGGSTVLAAELGKRVTSVESDRGWAARLERKLAEVSSGAQVHYVDVGPTGKWGRPVDNSNAAAFHRYALSVWDRPDFEAPDLVLIDGRFRAACLVAVLLRATRPTTVLFDDYVPRRHYHGVEHLAPREETVGRMARFTVTPGPIPPEMLTEAIGWFSDPR
jgi:hypothetical protein